MISFLERTDTGFKRRIPPSDCANFVLLLRNLKALGVEALIEGYANENSYVEYLRIYADEKALNNAMNQIKSMNKELLDRGWSRSGDKYISAVDTKTARLLCMLGATQRRGYNDGMAVVEFAGSARELLDILEALESLST